MPEEPTILFTRGKFVLALSAILVGASMGIYREYRDTGSVSESRLLISVVVALLGIVFLILLARYANKPEN